tara:strand:+ start:64 stop:978 length:915 start_codon:yes stop_codon:yes gene_type:complete
MTTKLSKIEVVNDNSEIILSYQTLEEKVQALKNLKVKWKEGVIKEKDIYLQRGEILRKIVNNKLYKLKYDKNTDSFKDVNDRQFEDFLKEDSKFLFNIEKSLTLNTANNYQAFYLLYNKVLSHKHVYEPKYIRQIIPVTNLILTDIDNAVEVWKGAYNSCKKDYPTQDEVNQAFIVHSRDRVKARQRAMNVITKDYKQAISEKEKTYEQPEVNKPTISISELQKYDGSVDAGLTCKAIASSYHQAKEALSTFKFTLYNFIQENGLEALNELKNIDVGIYSINNLDNKIEVLEQDLIKIKALLND